MQSKYIPDESRQLDDSFSLTSGVNNIKPISKTNLLTLKINPSFMENESNVQKHSQPLKYKFIDGQHKFPCDQDKLKEILHTKLDKISSQLQSFVIMDILIQQRTKKQAIQKVSKTSFQKKKKYLNQFVALYDESIETLKWSRADSLPQQNKQYYFGYHVLNQIQYKTTLKTLIKSQIKKFNILSHKIPFINEQKYNELVKQMQNYTIKHQNIISSQKIQKQINNIVRQETFQKKNDILNKSLIPNYRIFTDGSQDLIVKLARICDKRKKLDKCPVTFDALGEKYVIQCSEKNNRQFRDFKKYLKLLNSLQPKDDQNKGPYAQIQSKKSKKSIKPVN